MGINQPIRFRNTISKPGLKFQNEKRVDEKEKCNFLCIYNI